MNSSARTGRSKHTLLLVALALTAFALLFAGAGSAATNAVSASCASSEFTSEFFNNTDLTGSPVLTRCDADVNFNWGGGSPDGAVNSDHFTARFTGQQDFAAGWYSFNVTVDDMFRLYVDGQIVMDTWGDVQPPTSYSAVREMTAGTHTVVIEYGEVGGGAVIQYSATPTSAPPATFQFSAPSYSVSEHAGTATFTVTRTGDTSNEDSVSYTTAQWGDAIAGADYVDTSGTLTFAPGVTSATFTVDIVDDLAVEGDEYFYVYLPGSSAQIGYPDYADVQIIDDDAQPGDGNQTDLSITQTDSPDPTTVNQNTTYELTVTNNSLWTATNVSVLDTLPADSTLVSSPGCTDKSNGTVSCAKASLAPDATAAFSVTVKATSVGHDTNTAAVTSDTPDSDTSDNTANETTDVTGSVVSFDQASYTVTEGDTGQFLMLRSGSTADVSLLGSLTSGTADVNVDYLDSSWDTGDAIPLGFFSGTNEAYFPVVTTDDNIHEGPETLTISLEPNEAGVQMVAPSSATVTILDNDPFPTVSIDDVTRSEGGSGDTDFTFTVALSNPSYQDIGGSYHTADGTATAGVASDFAAGSGLWTVPAGQTSTTVTIRVHGDTTFEADETFTVELSGLANAAASGNDLSGLGTILNDDAPPTAPMVTPPVTSPVLPVPAASPCKITLTSEYIFQNLITYVGVSVTRDDLPLRGVVVYSRDSYAGEITNTRTNALGFVEYHFWANLPLQSVEFVADCDGNGLMPVSARDLRTEGASRTQAQEPAARVVDLGLLTTRNVSRIGTYVGQGQRTPKTQANCRSVSVSASSLKVGKPGSVTVKVSFDNQPVKAGGVVLSGAGIYKVKATRREGQVRFFVRPSRTGTLYVRVPNFAACDYVAALPVR